MELKRRRAVGRDLHEDEKDEKDEKDELNNFVVSRVSRASARIEGRLMLFFGSLTNWTLR